MMTSAQVLDAAVLLGSLATLAFALNDARSDRSVGRGLIFGVVGLAIALLLMVSSAIGGRFFAICPAIAAFVSAFALGYRKRGSPNRMLSVILLGVWILILVSSCVLPGDS